MAKRNPQSGATSPLLQAETSFGTTPRLEAEVDSSPSLDQESIFVPADFKYDPTAAYEVNRPALLTLRATDQETARVVAVHRTNGEIVGAGCLLDHRYILTCLHVVAAALGTEGADESDIGHLRKSVFVSLPGVISQPTVEAKIVRIGSEGPQNDLALLMILDHYPFQKIQAVEFASPLRHGGKSYSVLGFPGGNQQGRNAVGRLHAADTKGLVQMDRGGALSVLGGFSGAPVWSSDVSAFVGLVVTEMADANVSWCIPSRRLCEFYPALRVRFRIPPQDRPVINDRFNDDPNKQLFGQVNDNGQRRLSAIVRERKHDYVVNVYYECMPNSPPRGHYVSFITYPDFKTRKEDAYELVAEIKEHKSGTKWTATQEFYPGELFTVAAIGDAGDTVLTLDLENVPKTSRTRAKGS